MIFDFFIWLFDLARLISKNTFEVSEGTIEQYDDNDAQDCPTDFKHMFTN